jgi:hypothetical protein
MPWANDAEDKSFIEWAPNYFGAHYWEIATNTNQNFYNTLYTVYIGHNGKGAKPAWPLNLETLKTNPIKKKRVLNADYVLSK